MNEKNIGAVSLYFQSLLEEIRFLKTQQLRIVNYNVLLQILLASTNKLIPDTTGHSIFPIGLIVLSIFICIYSINFIKNIQISLKKCREKIENIINNYPKDIKTYITLNDEKNRNKFISFWYDAKSFIPLIIISIISSLISIFIIYLKKIDISKIDIKKIFLFQKILNSSGLIFEIIGVFLLSYEFFKIYKGRKFQDNGGILYGGEPGEEKETTDNFHDYEKKRIFYMKLGIFLIILGFIFQIISNWI